MGKAMQLKVGKVRRRNHLQWDLERIVIWKR